MTMVVSEPDAARTDPHTAPSTSRAAPVTRATLIVNPYSSGLTSRREREVVTTLRHHMDVDVRRTERSGHATQLASEAVEQDVDVVITCGGDGTAHEALNGMSLGAGTAAKRPRFALLPAGATNVLCRALGLPNDPVKAARVVGGWIAEGRGTPTNLGQVDERLFMFSAGIGFDGELVRRIDERRAGRRPSDFTHFTTLVGILTNERFAFTERMTITVDGSTDDVRASLLMVGNTTPLTYIGSMAMHFMPECALDDGLDFIAPRRSSAMFFARNALQAMGVGRRRRLLASEQTLQLHHDVDGFLVECDEPQPVQADGEYLGDRTHVRFDLIRDAIRMVR